MKINFSKREYRCLLDMLYAAQWIASAFDTLSDSQPTEQRELMQKMLSYAKDFGFDALVELSKDNGIYYATRQFEDETIAHDIIDQYDENTFWDELPAKLAQRDINMKYSAAQLVEMPHEQVMEEIWEIENQYNEEFETVGLQNLRIGIFKGTTRKNDLP